MNRDTNLCISIAISPGNFGANFHNRSYKALGLNWLYLPRKISSLSELRETISAVRTLEIKGCSVSMPFKEAVVDLVDELDESAKRTGAVNTILNDDGILKGFNTDLYGAKEALSELSLLNKEVFIIGSGGVAKAIAQAVKELGGNITIINRTEKTAIELARKIGGKHRPWKKLEHSSGFLLINATSVGMNNEEEVIISDKIIDKFEIIMDVIIYPSLTRLIKNSAIKEKRIITGIEMCVHQAARQFKIYTGIEAPKEIISEILKQELS